MRFITALSLTAGVAALAGCANDEHRDYTSPMYSSVQSPDLTQTCAYNEGPLAGQTIDYSTAPGAPAVKVGVKCADMQGSSGWAVPQQAGQQPGREQGGRFYTSPGAPSAWGSSGGLRSGYSLFCRFNSGPAAGHSADYSSTLGAQPVAIGSACSDGPNSGVAVGAGNEPAP
jgi:hypothetical protein